MDIISYHINIGIIIIYIIRMDGHLTCHCTGTVGVVDVVVDDVVVVVVVVAVIGISTIHWLLCACCFNKTGF